MAAKDLPDPELLRKLLRYEPETGKLFWRKRPPEMFGRRANFLAWNKRWAGKAAFTAYRQGYHQGRVLSQNLVAHRVIWALHTGAWPEHQIDHINGNRADNRWRNLRAVTSAENMRNKRQRSNNTSGVTGVSWAKEKRKWLADIRVNGKQIHIGRFDQKADAIAARKAAEKQYGFHPNHGRTI